MKGMYTSNGNYSLRNSFPETDSGIAKKLRESGVVILAKLGLSEYANSFGNQHSGFSNLTGQVLNALDTDATVERLVVGHRRGDGGVDVDARRRHRDRRLDHQPVAGQRPRRAAPDGRPRPRLRHRPDLGLAGHGRPDGAHRRERRAEPPVDRGSRSAQRRRLRGDVRPEHLRRRSRRRRTRCRTTCRRSIRTSSTARRSATTARSRRARRRRSRSTRSSRPARSWCRGRRRRCRPCPACPAGYQQHKGIDEYYKRLGPSAPIKSLVEEVADNLANEHEALKFGNGTHANAALSDVSPGGANETAYRAALPIRKAAQWKAMDDMIKYTNSDPSQPEDPVLAILGSVPSGPTAGTPQLTIPMGYSATTRRPLSVSIHGNKLSRAQPHRRRVRHRAGDEARASRRARSTRACTAARRPCRRRRSPSRGGCNPDYETHHVDGRHRADDAVPARDGVREEPAGHR